jgi:hypothetical protein
LTVTLQPHPSGNGRVKPLNRQTAPATMRPVALQLSIPSRLIGLQIARRARHRLSRNDLQIVEAINRIHFPQIRWSAMLRETIAPDYSPRSQW